jgi:hypothetical protein
VDKGFILAVVITIGIWLGVIVSLFNYNLPAWCANPQGNGNAIIQPLCK